MDVFHQIREVQLEPDASSFFEQALMEIEDQSIEWLNFVKEVSPYSSSLAQVLYHKDKIVKFILNNLQHCCTQSDALKSLLK